MPPLLPLRPDDEQGSASWWRSQLEWSTEIVKDQLPMWQRLAKAYRDELSAKHRDAIRVNIEYEKTEQKRHQLFFRVPRLVLRPSPRLLRDASTPDPVTGQPRDVKKAVAIFREYLQFLSGEKGANTQALLDQNLFDLLCPAGLGACKVGYERFLGTPIPIQIGVERVPAAGDLLVPGMTVERPIMGDAPNVLHERYYATRISPAKLLIPPEFTGKHYSRDAIWLGHRGYITKETATRLGWKVPSDYRPPGGDDDFRITELDRKGQRRDQIPYIEVFYFAQRVDDTVTHPERIRQLIFIDGVDTPVVHRDSRDQRWDARGRLIGGIRELPIRVITLRYVSDHPYPPSDCRISQRQGDELSEHRTLNIVHRKKSVPMRWMDYNKIVDVKVRAQIERGDYYDIVASDGPGDKMMGEVARAQYPRENFTMSSLLMNDVDRLWAMGPNQSAAESSTDRTATASALRQRATDIRLSAEQGEVLGYWIGIMEQLGQLVQLYADREDYIEVVGEAGARVVEAWDRETVRGEFLFSVVPDSASRPDAAADRDLALNRYNLLANSPYVDQLELARATTEVFGDDPDRLVRPPDPPPPEKPRISLSIKGDDLNPAMPQYQNVVNLLQVAGIPASLAPAPTAPAGDGDQGPAEVVDRERLRMAEADESDQRMGGLVGVGNER